MRLQFNVCTSSWRAMLARPMLVLGLVLGLVCVCACACACARQQEKL